jgi:hypothetical protein
MMKLYAIMLFLFIFILTGIGLPTSSFSAEIKSSSTKYGDSLLSRKRRKKKRRKKKRRKKKRRKKKRRKRYDSYDEASEEREAPRAIRRKGPFVIGGIGYFMASDVDFMPVVEAEGTARYTNAAVTYSSGVGFDFGVGYRVNNYFAAEGRLFLVYPIIGSQMTLTRDEESAPKAGPGKLFAPRVLAKGYFPTQSIDYHAAAGVGMTYLFKAVAAEDEGVAMSGLSYHFIVGADYFIKRKLSIGGSFEYSMIKYSTFDFWDPDFTDAAKSGVSLSQTIMTFGITATYKF